MGNKSRQISFTTHLHLIYDTPSVLDALDLQVLRLFWQQQLVEHLELAALRIEFYRLQNHIWRKF